MKDTLPLVAFALTLLVIFMGGLAWEIIKVAAVLKWLFF